MGDWDALPPSPHTVTMPYLARKPHRRPGRPTRYRAGKVALSGAGAGVPGPGVPGPLSGLDLQSIENALGAGVSVADDPYFNEVLCRIGQLHAIRTHAAVPVCQDTPLGLPGGVGLERVILPLRAFVFAEANPWAYVVGAAVLFGVPMLIGYQLGRGSRGGTP